MIPTTQTKFTSEDNTVHGNCLAACVASLLECDIIDVPAMEDCPSDGSWYCLLWDFLQERGFEIQGSFYVKPDEATDEWWSKLTHKCQGVEGFYIVTGTSPRSWVKRGHAVIYENGVMVHDPHPSGVGLIEPGGALMIERKES